MTDRSELRKQLIKRIIELHKEAGTSALYGKICVTSLLDSEETWERKEDSQVVFCANSIVDYSNRGELMVNLKVWHYYSHQEDAGACFLRQLSTDSLYDLIEYYENKTKEQNGKESR